MDIGIINDNFVHDSNYRRIYIKQSVDYEKIKAKLLEIQEMMLEIPQDCKGNSENACCNRKKYIAVKSMIRDLLEYL